MEAVRALRHTLDLRRKPEDETQVPITENEGDRIPGVEGLRVAFANLWAHARGKTASHWLSKGEIENPFPPNRSPAAK